MDIRLGKLNELEILRRVDQGYYLDAGEIGDVLLPTKEAPADAKIGEFIEVFLYLDSEERLIATTRKPLIQVGEFALLEVKWTNQYGAFLDWGLMKDLFCPFSEQGHKLEIGEKCLVYCYIDPLSYRIVASTRLHRFLSHDMPEYNPGDPVDALIWHRTDLGMKAVVDGKYEGLFFRNEIFQQMPVGQHVQAYIKQVREDGKIDLQQQPHVGIARVSDFSERLLQSLVESADGFCPLHDKSDAEAIYAAFGVSKKTFKRAVGDLYKRQYITLETDGIRLTDQGRAAGTYD